VNASIEALEKRANEQMDRDGIAPGAPRLRIFPRHAPQGPDQRGRGELPEKRVRNALWEPLHKRFYTRYEQLYGSGSSYGEARLEIVTLRLRATAATPRPKLSRAKSSPAKIDSKANCGKRSIYWADLKKVGADADLRRRFPRSRQRDQGAGGDRDDRHHRRCAPGALAQGGRLQQFRNQFREQA